MTLTTILIIIFCCFCYGCSWMYFSRNRFTPAVFLLMLAGFVLRLYTACDLFLHAWDERYHALVAKHFLLHPLQPILYETPLLPYDISAWGSNHIWLSKPPIPLWCTSLSLYCFGNHEIAVRLPAVIVSSLAILVTFQIGRLLSDTRTAFIAALLQSINGMLIETCAGRLSSDLVETFFLFFAELAVLMAIYAFKNPRHLKWSVLCGISIALAFLSKWIVALLIIPVCLVTAFCLAPLSLRSVLSRLLVIFLAACLPCLAWCYYLYTHFPAEAADMYHALLLPARTVVQEHSAPAYYYLTQLRIVFGEIVYLPLCWFLYSTFRKRGYSSQLVLATWVVLPLLFFSFAATKRASYILIIGPALFLMIAAYYTHLEQLQLTGYRKWLKYTVLVLLIALPLRYCIERVKPFLPAEERRPAWAQELKQLPERHNSKIVLFNYRAAIEAMFYTDFAAVYGYIPDTGTIRSLQQQGYTIWINDNGQLSADVRSLPGVVFRSFLTPTQ